MATRSLGGDLSSEWQALEAATAGEVILPGAAGYASVCALPVARFDDGFLSRTRTARPEAVVLCKEPADEALEVDELTVAAGCGATVGIAGLALGGGVGLGDDCVCPALRP
jgi:hypothetical protein